jgi:hypothetical protein
VDDDDMTEPRDQPPWAARAPSSVADRARDWLESAALSELVSALGGPRDATPRERERWSSATLDTRGGRERHDAPAVAWPEQWIDAILGAAGFLGLMSTPSAQRTRYDATIVLAGTTLGNRLRMELAAELARDAIEIGSSIIVLAADRALTGRELGEALPGERTETQNALRNAQEIFGPLQPLTDEVAFDGGREQSFATHDAGTVTLLVADPPSGVQRAGTVHALELATRHTAPAERSELLVVTSAIYVPFQFFRTAPIPLADGTHYLELIGTPTNAAIDRRALAQRLAQETHAAIHAAADLLEPT